MTRTGSSLFSSPFMSGLAAWALALALGFGVVFGLVTPPIARMHDLNAEIDTLEDQLERFNVAASGASIEPLKSVVDDALFLAPSPALAAARLQAVATQAIDEAGGEIISLRVEEPVPLDLVQKIAISLELRADASALLTLMHRLETASPYVFIERLDARRARLRRDDLGSEPTMSAIRLDIYGLAPPSSP